MNLKTMMIIKAVVCLVLGVPILFAPVFTYSLFGTTLNTGGVLAARQYSASIFGNMLVTWFARNAVDSQARRAIILDLCVYDAVGFVIALIAQLSGLLGPLGWIVVVVYLFFALGFGYFLLPHKEAA